MREIEVFREMGERVSKIAVGSKHVMVLTMRNRLFSWGANFKGQLGQGDNFNYSSPKLVVLPENLSYNAKILWIECGVFSSYVLLRNNIIYEFGENGRLSNQRKPVKLELNFYARFLENANEFHVSRIKSSWSNSMELTYLQVNKIGENYRSGQDKTIIDKTVKHWYSTNLIPNYRNPYFAENKAKKNVELIKNEQLYQNCEMIFRDEFRTEQEHKKNSILLEIDEIQNEKEMCVIDNQLLTFEKVLENWEIWHNKYSELKKKTKGRKSIAIKVLTEDELDFMRFFKKIKHVLMG